MDTVINRNEKLVEKPVEKLKKQTYNGNWHVSFINISDRKVYYMSHNNFIFEIPISEVEDKSLFHSCYAKDLMENFKNILIYKYEKKRLRWDQTLK